jgi:dTDP-L-rhamnose 4-epimerase
MTVTKRVLITGGAGFIGSHVADELLAAGCHVRAFDCLTDQVHGTGQRPPYLHPDVELVTGDVRDPEAVGAALQDVDEVVHLAARVGVGQSMYEIADYEGVNGLGTAVLLQALMDKPVSRLVVASSMSIYGEGLYVGADGAPAAASDRTKDRLEQRRWEPVGPAGQPITPVPTPETKPPALTSVYALNKYQQERLCLIWGSAYDVPTVALRFFNVYGPRQALSNPYTGVLAIFASRLLNGRPPLVYEDGEQRRDFVNVADVARACRLALESDRAAGEVLNIGSGQSVSIAEVGRRLAAVMGIDIEPEMTGRYRLGDIRHCFADISKAREVLGYAPATGLDEGMAELAGWLEGQEAVDRIDDASRELAARGLTR